MNVSENHIAYVCRVYALNVLFIMLMSPKALIIKLHYVVKKTLHTVSSLEFLRKKLCISGRRNIPARHAWSALCSWLLGIRYGAFRPILTSL